MAHETEDGAARAEHSADPRQDNLKPQGEGKPPRPATEPDGAQDSTRNSETATDPATGEPNPKRSG